MKVLLWGNKLFTIDMLWGFQQLGCEAKIIQAETVEQIQNILDDEKADLLITMGAPTEFKCSALEYVGKRPPTSMKYIHWDTDGISSTYFRSVSGDGIEMDVIYLSKPDLILSMCPEMCDFLQKKNYTCEMMYYAYSPISHRPMSGYDNDKYYINLIGISYVEFFMYNPNHYRYKSIKILLKPLLENGYEVHFYGDTGYRPLIKMLLDIDVPELYFHRYLPYERTSAAYNSSFINLVTQNHDQTITKRTFEILGSGGFALSSDNSELRKLFVPGRDLALSSSPEQTLELVRYYKENPDAWRKVRENGLKSVENHTYKQRAEYILELIKKYWP
jgi:spore maturation protein CgeB